MTVNGPEDKWDTHPKPWWAPVFKEAKARGWSQRTYDGHSWGAIYCPARECDIDPIFSTPSDKDTFAKTAMKIVRRCPHRPGDQKDAVAYALDHLDAAERFADAAEHFIARDGYDARAAELVELADDALDAEREFDVASEQSVASDYRARDLLEGTEIEDAQDAAPVVEAANQHVDDADSKVSLLPTEHDERPTLTQRRDALRERVDSLKVQVGLE